MLLVSPEWTDQGLGSSLWGLQKMGLKWEKWETWCVIGQDRIWCCVVWLYCGANFLCEAAMSGTLWRVTIKCAFFVTSGCVICCGWAFADRSHAIFYLPHTSLASSRFISPSFFILLFSTAGCPLKYDLVSVRLFVVCASRCPLRRSEILYMP